MIFEQDVERSRVSRRQAIRIGLATASLLVLSSCQSPKGSGADLDKAHRSLRRTLDNIAGDDNQQARLASIARRIENRSRELVEEHDEFRARFDALSRDRDTTAAELDELVSEIAGRRTAQRNELLHLQDELRAELTAEEWAEAVKVLTQTKHAIARPPVSEG